jgi:hypothetical protein
MRWGWYGGTKAFKKALLARMEGRLGANHAGQLRREAAEANPNASSTANSNGRVGRKAS